ncbi:heme NO-binding domain-containing protein [Vibrio neptunius]|uniref:Heme NO-binding domain-containing protein n=1 Tax=Vibrio neptunius TaxID=170651 RepID=A0ABS2ZYT7_9VIBR|nr:heme NO-binding domain-containing protein [Vibrio neptunius]KJY93090.1 guanylate cyclase [Vibrio neptunius]MBN3492662.1 heme NO-binding domain-containing protein [Vibrio neptunius]MBN3515159.1 heme NO-binding domain-containing protein [Vibrio neptunius]MBN3548965.1 heme NO-binding domain-containing protein [Vibrio neptunius]MBN3572842.1 heme NO-binding domain-containing protein [Vibrio neptunius]
MKGLIFTEFMDLVEEKFGLDALDKLLSDAGDEGVYTSVGSYDHRDLVKLIVQLSKQTGISAEELQRVFGQSVFENLYQSLPERSSLQGCKNSLQFIRLVEDYIHIEVKKLYQQANPPRFEFISETETEMVFDYKSARCMSHVCLGLIEGCAQHFNESLNIEMENNHKSGNDVRFKVAVVG